MGLSRGLDHRLVGRAPECAAARRAVQAGRSGVVFVGESGVGTSSLARAVADDLSGRDRSKLVWLTGSANTPPIPFGVFAPLAPDHPGTASGRPLDPLSGLQTFRTAILKKAAGRPLVLAVDDAHLLDDHSATLVHQLVSQSGAKLVMAMRSRVPVPPPLRSLWKDEQVERIDVGPLDRAATAELVAEMLAGREGEGGERRIRAVGGELAETVWLLSAGHPLYIRELLKTGWRSGRIQACDGMWRLNGRLEVGPGLAEIVHERLDKLTPAEKETLDMVAFAEPLPVRPLLPLVAPVPLEGLQSKELVRFEWVSGEQAVRTAHPLIGEVIRDALPVTRAAGLGRHLADAFEADGRLEADLLRIVSWRLDGGDDPPGDLLLRAARRAADSKDWRLAARLAEAAADRDAGCEAVLTRADALRALGRAEEALAALGDEEGSSDDQIARAAVLRASVLCTELGRLGESLDVLARAGKRIGDPAEREWLETVELTLGGFSIPPDEVIERSRDLLGRTGLTPRAEITARSSLSMGLSWTGRTDQAIEVLDGIDPEQSRVAFVSGCALTARAWAYRASGRVEALERLARARYESAVQLHDQPAQALAAGAMGWAALERARLPRAVSSFREAVVSMPPGEPPATRVEALLGLAEALALTGDIEGSRATLEEARPALGRRPSLHLAWSVTAAWLAAAQGATSDALTRLGSAADAARAGGQTAWEIRALHASVRLGSGAAAGRLAELAAWVEGPLVQIAAAHARALGQDRNEDMGAALDGVAELYAEPGLHLYAAEAAAQACRAHTAGGHGRLAAASSARGHFLLGPGDGPPPIGLALALSPPRLTRREREVALLAAGGLASQTIAARLCLSVRTVETHLARVYTKLGINSRSDLAPALVSAAGDDRLEALS